MNQRLACHLTEALIRQRHENGHFRQEMKHGVDTDSAPSRTIRIDET